jgi:hypothetical protein
MGVLAVVVATSRFFDGAALNGGKSPYLERASELEDDNEAAEIEEGPEDDD